MLGLEYVDEEKETFKCECLDCGHKLVSKKHCVDLVCPKCGGKMRRQEKPGDGRGDDPDESKPYANEHSCRLEDPGQFDKFARTSCFKKVDDKCIDYIFGIKGSKSKVQALRFNEKVWTEKAARSYCKSKDGFFEAAKK